MIRVSKVLSQSVEGWLPELRPVVRLVRLATIVVFVVWVMFKGVNPTYSYFGDKVIMLFIASVAFTISGLVLFKLRGPEEIGFDEYLANPDQWLPLLRTHWERNKEWIKKEAKRLDYVWVVVAGNEIVSGGKFMRDFPDKEAQDRIGRVTGLVPFAYGLIDIVSESETL